MLLAFFARGRPAYPCLKIGPVGSPSFWSTGSTATRRRLSPWFQIVYKERRLAHYHLQSERPDHTLQSTDPGARGLPPAVRKWPSPVAEPGTFAVARGSCVRSW